MSASASGVELTPAPPDVFDRLDQSKICAELAASMTDDETAAVAGKRCGWSLEGFDEFGLGEVTLMSDRGEPVAWALVHWSTIVTDA